MRKVARCLVCAGVGASLQGGRAQGALSAQELWSMPRGQARGGCSVCAGGEERSTAGVQVGREHAFMHGGQRLNVRACVAGQRLTGTEQGAPDGVAWMRACIELLGQAILLPSSTA